MGGRISHCSAEGHRTGGCKLKFIRDVVTNEHDLDNSVLLPIKVIFYALAIALVLLMIGRQIALYRAKKQQVVMLKGVHVQHFADEDVEKAPYNGVHLGDTTSH